MEALLAYWNERVVAQAGTLLTNLLLAILAIAIVVAVARLALRAERRALGRTRAHANARLLIDRLIQFAFLLIATIWALSIFGVPLTALAAALGVAGLAVSLALQDVLKNLVAGLYILIERPFTIGDHVEFRTFSGIVETIELRTTALRMRTGSRVVIPNAMLFADALVNRSVYGRQLVRLRVATPVPAGNGAPPPGEGPPVGLQSPPAAAPPVSLPGTDGRAVADALLRMVEELGAQVDGPDGPPPTVVVETLSKEKITLRAELWASDARQAAPQVAWAVRHRLPQAEITVLE